MPKKIRRDTVVSGGLLGCRLQNREVQISAQRLMRSGELSRPARRSEKACLQESGTERVPGESSIRERSSE